MLVLEGFVCAVWCQLLKHYQSTGSSLCLFWLQKSCFFYWYSRWYQWKANRLRWWKIVSAFWDLQSWVAVYWINFSSKTLSCHIFFGKHSFMSKNWWVIDSRLCFEKTWMCFATEHASINDWSPAHTKKIFKILELSEICEISQNSKYY